MAESFLARKVDIGHKQTFRVGHESVSVVPYLAFETGERSFSLSFLEVNFRMHVSNHMQCLK